MSSLKDKPKWRIESEERYVEQDEQNESPERCLSEEVDGKAEGVAAQARGSRSSELPDDVLLKVFSNLDSFIDLLRVAAANKRFRKCVFKVMKTPWPLKLDFQNLQLCHHQLPEAKWPAVVKLLAREARFDRIEIGALTTNSTSYLSAIFEALLSVPDCLSELTSFNTPPTQLRDDLLYLVLSNCPKLSKINLAVVAPSVPPNSVPVGHYVPLDLAFSLKDKPVAQLKLDLITCNQQQVIGLLLALRPNCLQKLHLSFMLCESVNVVQLAWVLCDTAAESIGEIECLNELGFFEDENEPASVSCPLGQLFNYVPHLPSLHRLSINVKGLEHLEEFIPAVRLLLSNHARTTPLVVDYKCTEWPHPTGLLARVPCCQLLALVQPLLQELPNAVFCLNIDTGMNNDESGWKWNWKISLGNASLLLATNGESCHVEDCHTCNSCFPVVLNSLSGFARREESGHLENRWLSRCRIEHLVQHPFMKEKGAVHAVENSAHDTATVWFEPENGTQFEITVATSRCFERSCIRCLQID